MIKEMAVFGGFAHRSEAVEYQQKISEETVLVRVLNGPNGFPVTPLCYFAVGVSLIEEFKKVLETEPKQELQSAQKEEIIDPSGDFLRTAPDKIEEEPIVESPVETVEVVEQVEEVEVAEPEVEKKPIKKRGKNEQQA